MKRRSLRFLKNQFAIGQSNSILVYILQMYDPNLDCQMNFFQISFYDSSLEEFDLSNKFLFFPQHEQN